VTARSAVLDRVKRARTTMWMPAVESPRAGSPRPSEPGAAALLERFTMESKALGVAVHVEESAEAVRARVAAIVGARSALKWDDEHLPFGVGEVLREAATGASPRGVQAAAAVGVTGCDAAIAETGSLAMLSGPGKPRSASLLPPLHVCVMERRALIASMGQFFAARASDIGGAACCYFVTGPSRTADIELTLTLGVHGPGVVVVVVGPE
jgi:L-lactate dehydrogenase complex protein LldG